MKIALSSFLFLFFCLNAFANHFVGADMTYNCIGNGQYFISLTVYRDCGNGGPPLLSSYPINVFNLATNAPVGNGVTVSHDGIIPVISESDDPCIEIPSDLCLEKAVYTGVILLPNSDDGYLMNFNDCCFAQNVGNILNQSLSSLSVSTIIPPINSVSTPCNGSPIFNEEPPLAICLYDDLSLDLGATWATYPNATLTYAFYTPDGNDGDTPPPFNLLEWLPDYGADYAIPSDSTMEINTFTGEITGTPMQLGYYLMGVKVTAIENGEVVGEINRVFRYIVVDCNINRSVAGFEVEPICGDLLVEFSNNSFGADSYEWNFDDVNSPDNTTSEEAPSHLFTDYGTYMVRLITSAGNNVCTDTSYLEVILEDGAESQIIVNNAFQCLSSQNFDFQANTTKPNVTYEWEFGPNANIQTSTSANPSNIVFNQTGEYSILLHTYYMECESTTSLVVEVFDGLLSEIEGPAEGCAPFNATFDASVSNPNYTYTWTINGSVFNGEQINYMFTEEGVYDVILDVIDENGCESTAIEQDFIHIYEEPQTGFEISDTYITIGDVVEIENTVKAGYDIQFDIPEYEFTATTQSNFVYTFNEEGIYEINQTVINGACTNELTKTIHVGPREVIVPNVFSPNQDQLNDFFYIKPHYNINMVVYIYDRWGVEIFSSNNYELCNPVSGEFCWDGRNVNGKQCKAGTYAYTLVLPSGFKTNGFVQIFR